MFPSDGSNAYLRFEQLEVDMHLTFFDLGNTDQLNERLRELNIIPEGEKPHFVDSEIPSEMSQLVFTPDASRIDHLGRQSAVVSIRKITTLIPNSLPWMKTLTRQIKTKVENSLFLHILQFDKFPSR
jgi:hypothetical protein